MNMLDRLTRRQLTLAYVGLLALLWATSSLFNVPAGVDRNLSAMASSQVTTTSAAGDSAP
jgi:hypothetical protein